MGVGLVRSLQPPDILWIHWRVYNSTANTSKRVLFLCPSDVYVRSFLYLLYTLIKLCYTHTHKILNIQSLYGDMGFPGGSDSKEFALQCRRPGSIPGLGRSPGKGSGNPLQYSCLENSTDGDPDAWECKESDMTEQLTLSLGYEDVEQLGFFILTFLMGM